MAETTTQATTPSAALDQRFLRSSSGISAYLYDTDPGETGEWIQSLNGLIDHAGPERARYIIQRLIEHAHEKHLPLAPQLSTDYVNTIPTSAEPEFPGDEELEHTCRRFIRWNAAMMVHRAQRPGIEVGGHISTYASSASLYEVGFNHFFRGNDHPQGPDQVFIQGHASPGIYARAYLEGRLSEQQLDGFRQEISHQTHGGGLPSYPHPRNMPKFWQFPTVSMGLGPMNAIYQARFNHYLHDRGICDTSGSHVWAFLGDGEMDEPESRGFAHVAALEGLDNLTFVINCNLQRLDGPVRGNGKIIQELESHFRGSGWNVIKVIWGRGWDALLDADHDGALVQLMNETYDGDYQTFKARDGAYVREHFFGRDPRTKELVADYTDEQIWKLRRGGHDYRKIYAAYAAARAHTGQPTVILAHTIKGYSVSDFEGRNATHQMKKLTLEQLKTFRDTHNIPISDAQLSENPYLPPYYHPGEGSPEHAYLTERRRALGGYLPQRRTTSRPLTIPSIDTLNATRKSSGTQKVATTMALVRIFRELLKDPNLGKRIVPIIPDEARTFGMDSWFPNQKIYNRNGQLYTAVDAQTLLAYKESAQGQILHEGINEAGSTGSFIAAGTSYSTFDQPMIPLYIFYSMFGFQRTGDNLWAAADQMTRGFLIGATAGKTTLTGEGLQHADGHSPLLAATNPAITVYDPAYAYELTHIIHHGLTRMYGDNSDNTIVYITVYNEPITQPAEPDNLTIDHLIRGAYICHPTPDQASQGTEASQPTEVSQATILASGISVHHARQAQEELAHDHGITTTIISVTSWINLHRDGLAQQQARLNAPTTTPEPTHLQRLLEPLHGPVIGVSDFSATLQESVRNQISAPYYALGADGFGLSDTREAARAHYGTDTEHIVRAVRSALSQN